MILQRIAASMKKRDWGTVVLEVLIVVVGLFIGLQVDDWNQRRLDRERETEYLQRIDRELAADIAEFERGVTLANRRREYARLIMGAVEAPEAVRRDPTGFFRALVRAGFTYSPTISDHTFEEIKSAGELGIIRDTELRSAITEYYQQVRQYGQWSYLREITQTEYIKRQAGILTAEQFQAFWVTRDAPEVPREEAMAAFERMLAKQAFIEWLPMVVANRTDANGMYGAAKGTAEILRAKIAESLGSAEIDRGKNQ